MTQFTLGGRESFLRSRLLFYCEVIPSFAHSLWSYCYMYNTHYPHSIPTLLVSVAMNKRGSSSLPISNYKHRRLSIPDAIQDMHRRSRDRFRIPATLPFSWIPLSRSVEAFGSDTFKTQFELLYSSGSLEWIITPR